MIKSIFSASDLIQDGRTLKDVFTYGVEEMGELATEVNIATGFSRKAPGKDGIVGEAIDVITCMIDLIHLYRPEMTEQDLKAIVNIKLQKWVDNRADFIKL